MTLGCRSGLLAERGNGEARGLPRTPEDSRGVRGTSLRLELVKHNRQRRGATPKITPNLWFDTNGLEAAEFYVSVFPNSAITDITYYGEAGPGPAGTVLTVEFKLDGRPFTVINGGPAFTFSEAISFLIECQDQDEIDYYWEKLSAGGEKSQCGWLKDRCGVSWQVCPAAMKQILNDSDPGRAERAMRAMLSMGKIDLAALHTAADRA